MEISSSDREKVEFFFSCRSLKNMDVFSKSDPQIIFSVKTPSNQWAEFGRTEVIKDNLNPNFSKTFQIDYIFEVQQHIKFDCIDIDSATSFDFIGSAITTVGHIVGSKNQMSVFDLVDKTGKKTGKLIVRAEKVGNCRESIFLKLKGHKLTDLHIFSKTNPFIRLLRISEDGMKIKVHETEHYKSNLNPVFQSFELKLQKLCNGDHLRPIKLELWDYSSSGQHKFVGDLDFTIHQLVGEKKKEFVLKDAKKKSVGSIIFDQCTLISKPEFMDYLRGGVQLSLIVAIDFTGSNGVPSRPDSLHAIRPNGEKNQYQQAISAVGEILLNYDYDKQVPVYGFGGKPKLPHFFSNVALHCFPCNGNPLSPEVFGLEGIETVYSQILPNVELAGPTLFCPLIEETMKLAEVCKINGSKVYNILLILTDGEINDMDKSASAIIDAACLPLSIIIIGIGNADFGKMEYLDGDNGLVDSSGRKAKRDLVQFVPFNKYKSNPMKLAENVLEELPMQLCEYMRMVGIKPDPPQMVDINNMKLSMPNNNVGNFGQNLINAGFMTNIINQELASNPINPMNATNPMKNMNRVNNMNSVGNQRPTMDNPINPAPFGMADAPHFGSLHSNQNPQNMNYSKGPTYQGVPPQGTNSYGQQGQNIGYGQSNGTGYGQPNPIGYGQNTVGQDPYGQNRGIGQNNMPYGQNYNNQNQGNAPGNVMSPTGQYKY